MSEQIDALAPALRKAKKVFQPVIKTKTVQTKGYVYKYADFANCVEAIEQALDENNLSFSQSVETEEAGKVVVTLLLHDSGQWLKSKFPLESVAVQGNAMQQIGAGVTYAKRYALCGILGIATEDDDAQSLSTKKAEIKAIATHHANLTNKFMAMCKDASLEVKEFAQFAGVTRDNPGSITNAIENFESLKESYLEVQKEAA